MTRGKDDRRDTVFREPLNEIKDFVFDEQVASVFDDMINRSVPLYQEVQQASAALARRFVRPKTRVYDLGCSTGTTLIHLAQAIPDDSVELVGVDSSGAMLQACRAKLVQAGIARRVRLVQASINDIVLENASVVMLNYTLQFVSPPERPATLSRIADGLPDGGALVISEKIIHASAVLQESLTELYYDFKRNNGYSELEISQKRDALERVLLPYTTEENLMLLRDSGFRTVEVFLKWFTFSSFVAVK